MEVINDNRYQNGIYGLDTPIDSRNSSVRLRPAGSSVSSSSKGKSKDSLGIFSEDFSSMLENAATSPIITIADTIPITMPLFNQYDFSARSINLSVKKRNEFLVC